MQNPKYLQKLGIVRNILNSEVQGPDQNKDQKIVDELCNAIKQGFNLKEFKYFCQQIFSVDAKGNPKANSENFNFNFETIGSQGWNCLHVACTTGKADIVEYLLNNL